MGCLEKKISRSMDARVPAGFVTGCLARVVYRFLMVISQFLGTDGWAGPKAGCSGTIRVGQWKNRP